MMNKLPTTARRKRPKRYSKAMIVIGMLLLPWIVSFIMVMYLHATTLEHHVTTLPIQRRTSLEDSIASTIHRWEEWISRMVDGKHADTMQDETLGWISRPSRGTRRRGGSWSKADGKEKDLGALPIPPQFDTDELRPIYEILKQGAYNVHDPTIFSKDVMASLPRWSQIEELYGPPKIVGLETCKAYRDTVPEKDRIAGVAGTFNSGTNVLSMLLVANCANMEHSTSFYSQYNKRSMQWQVPWGKHVPAKMRLKLTADRYESIHQENVIPVVTVRDPYTWMQSMCRQNYNARFDHAVDNNCPNIVPYPSDIAAHPRYAKMKHVPIHVKYSATLNERHESLPGMWNEWYAGYYREATFPHLIVRMEDLIFRGKSTIRKICDCVGGHMLPDDKFIHFQDVANINEGIELGKDFHQGLLRSLIKYGNKTTRSLGYPDFQLEAARDVLDPEMMNAFGYKHVPMEAQRAAR